VSELTHFGQIETFELRLGANPLADDGVDEQINDVAEYKDKANERDHADKLRHQLPGIAIEQAGHRSIDAVPGAAIIALSVRKQPDGDDAPETIDSVYRNGAHGVVH